MTQFTLPNIEPHVLTELLDEIRELHQQSEAALIQLEQSPQDQALAASLFRAVHTIKGDLGIVGLSPMITLVGHAEDMLSAFRNEQLQYSSLISDIILTLLDQVVDFVSRCRDTDVIDYPEHRYRQFGKDTNTLLQQSEEQRQHTLRKMLAALDPNLVLDEDYHEFSSAALDEDSDDPLAFDLHFFRDMMENVERRSSYWHGRAERQVKVARLINRFADSPVDEKQLTAACYLHDFGMGFLSLDLLHQQSPLSDSQRQQIESHVYLSAKLLENLPQWKSAKMMVLQHHEQADGQGYPLGLREDEICDGAKILAIVDTFEAMTHERAHEHHMKRPIRRSVAEINRLAGTQLSPYWVTVFNEAMQSLMSGWR
ncbi:metal-dependent phosphohydrolase [Idiomarina tyrosinivorans]|uniref:Metal-dependent phosphohydrolase n=1 Tax=Idiomarina tyrosinivorans TaxID=1445662 RepID=A0A432ZG12_9GAMM|nr:HD domain-containing phosphohydrolase [Idiomarina tyrosinivorans]RUO76917.1 metal-dependent phosphohydrolase [Idiomarina tyrosinivorans]